MASTELPWQIWGRRIHPFSFAIFIATVTVAVYLGGFGEDAGGYVFHFSGYIGRTVGIAAAIASLCLFLGFILNNRRTMKIGLLIAVGVFTSRCALFMMDIGVDSFPMWISLSLTVGAAGAWLLERAE